MTVTDVHDCGRCGQRCDDCNERMCLDGPAPAVTCVAHPLCVDCVDPRYGTACGECRREQVLGGGVW